MNVLKGNKVWNQVFRVFEETKLNYLNIKYSINKSKNHTLSASSESLFIQIQIQS